MLGGLELAEGADVDLLAAVEHVAAALGKVLPAERGDHLRGFDPVAAEALVDQLNLDLARLEAPDLDVADALDALEGGLDEILHPVRRVVHVRRHGRDEVEHRAVVLVETVNVDAVDVVRELGFHPIDPVAEQGIGAAQVRAGLELNAYRAVAVAGEAVDALHAGHGADDVFDLAGDLFLHVARRRVGVAALDVKLVALEAVGVERDGDALVGDKADHQHREQNHDHRDRPVDGETRDGVGGGLAAHTGIDRRNA